MILPLGKVLIELGYVEEKYIKEALNRQRKIENELRLKRSRNLSSILLSINVAKVKWKDRRLGKILMEMGVATPEQIEEALQKQKEVRSKHISSISAREATVLTEVPSMINSALNVYDLLTNVMVCCNTLVDSMASALFICDEKTEELAVSFYTGHEVTHQTNISRANSVAGWVIENNESIIVDDFKSDTRFSDETEKFFWGEIRSAACIPVSIRWQVVGAIEVINKKQGDSFSPKDLALLSMLANQVGITLENIRLLGDLDQSLEDLKKAQGHIIRSEKLRALGAMAGGIAHDFNNLLTGIQGNTSLMLMDMDPTHRYYERLKTIEKQVQSGARLTSHLLGYARKGKYEVNTINLNQLVKNSSESFGRTKKEIAILTELAEDLFAIKADYGQVEQVLFNLYMNAADAMPDGGDIILTTMNVTHKDMNGKLYGPKPGNYVLLMVTDTGTGMDIETMGRIFDPFFTTKEIGRGTGLGLASAYGIIKGHGGYIDVESKKRHGTTFRIYFPASEKKVRKIVKTSEEVIKGSETVLLVDDDEVVMEVGRDLLGIMGYRVLLAKEGKEAIEVYRKNQQDIDLVVLDMVMPKMGGGVVYDKLKKINPDIKVLLSSGYSIDGKATEILERGCDGFIQKPFKMHELSEKIREVLEKK